MKRFRIFALLLLSISAWAAQKDVLSIVAPSDQFRATSYLSGSTPNITYLSAPDANGEQQLVYIKGLAGYPWDWMVVRQDAIYQLLTENVWSDPTSGKIYLVHGAARFPRYIDYSPNQPPGVWQLPDLYPPQTSYIVFGPGSVPVQRLSNGIVRCTLAGPFPGTAVGDLPAGNDWTITYERGGVKQSDGSVWFGAKEVFTHREGFGRYKWEMYNATNGIYSATPAASSSTTIIKPLPSVVLPVQKIF